MLASLIPALVFAHLADVSNNAPPPLLYEKPKHLKDALRRPDAEDWAQSHDACIDHNIELGDGVPTPVDTIDPVKLVTPRWL